MWVCVHVCVYYVICVYYVMCVYMWCVCVCNVCVACIYDVGCVHVCVTVTAGLGAKGQDGNQEMLM